MQRSAGRGAWARTEFAATLVVALVLFSGGCKSSPKGANAGEVISADLPLGSYVRPHAVGSTGDPTKFFFPTLEIYDDTGALIYSSHESVENAYVLQGLPASIQNLRAIPGAPSLADVIEDIPAFRARKQDILRYGKPTVLSVVLEDCEACMVQEDAWSAAQHRLFDNAVNMLVIHISHP